MRALCRDGLLVALLHHEVALRALDEIFLELVRVHVPVGVGVLLEHLLAQLLVLPVELELGLVGDRQGRRGAGLVDETLLVAAGTVPQALARRRHNVLDVGLLDLDIAAAGYERPPAVLLCRLDSGSVPVACVPRPVRERSGRQVATRPDRVLHLKSTWLWRMTERVTGSRLAAVDDGLVVGAYVLIDLAQEVGVRVEHELGRRRAGPALLFARTAHRLPEASLLGSIPIQLRVVLRQHLWVRLVLARAHAASQICIALHVLAVHILQQVADARRQLRVLDRLVTLQRRRLQASLLKLPRLFHTRLVPMEVLARLAEDLVALVQGKLVWILHVLQLDALAWVEDVLLLAWRCGALLARLLHILEVGNRRGQRRGCCVLRLRALVL